MTTTQSFCNVLAREKGLDPAGSAGVADTFVAWEMPLPWPKGLFLDETLMPPEFIRAFRHWRDTDPEQRPRIRPLVVAPDKTYSQPGYRHVWRLTRPDRPFADFERTAYLIPEAQLGPLLAELYQSDARNHDAYRLETDTRNFLVCTHGAVDAACAKFGFPLYRHLREGYAGSGVRAWRVTHFGGHVFAPTLLELPAGRYWAYIDAQESDMLVHRRGDIRGLYGHYRGWSGCETGFLQAAEREVWLREGWEWFAYRKQGLTLQQDDADEPSWSEVRLEFTRPDGVTGAYEARVELGTPVVTKGNTASDQDYPYPQYKVVRLDKTVAEKGL